MSTYRSELHQDLSDVVRMLMERARRANALADEQGDTQSKRKATTGKELAELLNQHAPNVGDKLALKRIWSLNDMFTIMEHYGLSMKTMEKLLDEAKEHRHEVELILSDAS